MDTLLFKLEYMQIIQIIEKYCKTYLGKKLCLRLIPKFNFEQVESMLLETKEISSLLYQKGLPIFFEVENLEKYIKLLESNQVLSTKALLEIAKLLKMAASLHSYFYNDANFDKTPFSHIESYFSLLYSNPTLEKNISDKILDENTIADNASAKLASLRKNKKNLEAQVKEKLNFFLYSSNYSKYIMEPIVTIRNNRYVIPVKEEYKDMIKGFIHDTSSSGSTLYIEPTAIFELNNQINHIKIEEDLEIENILQLLSSSLFSYTQELMQNINCISIIDLLFAKATYGKDYDATIPQLTTKKEIHFFRAKHPLLDKLLAVPIDISLGKDFNCLLITGPNTGGKTVALKTIGLLLLMAYSGIPIPCHEKSSIFVFSKIFVDIGDEQSISESLSTFSAHMKNLVNITNKADSSSLVLVDELGSGTDPVEGSALAISILSYLTKIGSLICCTTHYPELKEFALVTEGFENASFEFDLENLKPTYHLLIGIPGKSNAFEISKKLGLSSQILKEASSYLKEDKIGIEELLKNIYDDKLTIEKEKEEIQKNLNQITNLRQSLEQKDIDLTTKKQSIIDKAKQEAREIILDAKQEINELLQALNDKHVNIKQANQNRNRLNEKLKNLAPTPNITKDTSLPLTPSEIKQNMQVWIPSLQSSGTVLSSHVTKSGEVLLQVGSAKMNLNLKQLSKTTATSSKSVGEVHTTMNSKAQFVSSEINVIGYNVEDAIYVIDKYIDNCAMAHLSPIRIVHGKGTRKTSYRNSHLFKNKFSCKELSFRHFWRRRNGSYSSRVDFLKNDYYNIKL
ncbi:MAG: endonuclease MutS2 [Clostridia bacterium]|nr:endonuclease MutS2 [Clostridia bacterium]